MFSLCVGWAYVTRSRNLLMPRLCRNALSASTVRTAGPGSYVDGNGLMLRVKASGTRQWIQRLTIHGRRV